MIQNENWKVNTNYFAKIHCISFGLKYIGTPFALMNKIAI